MNRQASGGRPGAGAPGLYQGPSHLSSALLLGASCGKLALVSNAPSAYFFMFLGILYFMFPSSQLVLKA